MAATTVLFQHSKVGNLSIDNGLDTANWAYNLNTAVYPTYGGEVVQILSVYIDDLTLGGTVATNSQCEAIYSYFAAYFQIATQGTNPKPQAGQSAYNLEPVIFTYPERGWTFKLYPKQAPGFGYDWDAVGRSWRLIAHVVDDSLDLDPIKNAIKNAVVQSALVDFKRINGEISPDSGDPETNPFQTYDLSAQQAAAGIQKNADYYASLIPAYSSGDFSALTGGLGSKPRVATPPATTPGAATTPSGTTPSGPGSSRGSSSGGPSVPPNPKIVLPTTPLTKAQWQAKFNSDYNAEWNYLTSNRQAIESFGAGYENTLLQAAAGSPGATAAVKRWYQVGGGGNAGHGTTA